MSRELQEGEHVNDLRIGAEAEGANPLSPVGRRAVQGGEVAIELPAAVNDALAKNEISKRHYSYARRYASEAAARFTIGNGAVDLDEVAREKHLGHQGDNYPIYDVSSQDEVASVKTHWNLNGELDVNSLSAYKRDFHKMLGWDRNVNALSSDGGNIVVARESGVPVPEGLEMASAEEAAVYLRDYSLLRIPDDHVDAVRAALEQEVRQFPGTYFLSNNPTDEQVQHILDRVQGIGVTSAELQGLIDSNLKTR